MAEPDGDAKMDAPDAGKAKWAHAAVRVGSSSMTKAGKLLLLGDPHWVHPLSGYTHFSKRFQTTYGAVHGQGHTCHVLDRQKRGPEEASENGFAYRN